jgi:hypothetical protein
LTNRDGCVLVQLINTLVEDSDLMEFFENIPGFCQSSAVRDPVGKVTKSEEEKLRKDVTRLLEPTHSSDLPYSRRLVACVNVADSVRLPSVTSSILDEIFPRDRDGPLPSVEMGHSLRDGKQQEIGLCAQSIVAGIISNVQESNDSWVSLAADQLGKSEDVILGYLGRGTDNVMLANLTHITRQIFDSSKDMALASSFILPSLSNFDVRNTLPELQRDFLALWNQIEQAPNDEGLTEIRENLLNVYNALTTPPYSSDSTYPVHASTDPTPPLGSQGRSGASRAVASSSTAATGHVVSAPL